MVVIWPCLNNVEFCPVTVSAVPGVLPCNYLDWIGLATPWTTDSTTELLDGYYTILYIYLEDNYIYHTIHWRSTVINDEGLTKELYLPHSLLPA